MEIDEVIIKESPGLCRCCLSDGCYKDLASEYPWMGENEVYADMLLECFDIGISQHADGPNGPNRLICEVCITRLRDACNFKKQVVEAEKRFVDMLGRGDFRMKNTHVVEISGMKLEPTLEEEPPEEEVEYLEDIDFGDDEPLQKLASTSKQCTGQSTSLDAALPAKKTRGRPRKSTSTVKVSKSKTSDVKPKATRAKEAPDVIEDDHRLATLRYRMACTRLLRMLIDKTNATLFKWHRGEFFCYFCGEPFPEGSELVAHTKTAHVNQKIGNPLKDIKSRDSVKVDITDLTCRLCGDKTCLNDLLTHMSVHGINHTEDLTEYITPFRINEERLACVVCGESFNFFGTLLIHTNKTHFKRKKCICESCGKHFVSSAHLHSHIKAVHENTTCKKCKKTFETMSELRSHCSVAHPHECKTCGEKFASKSAQLHHMATLHDVKRLINACASCDFKALTKAKLENHKRRVHLKELSHECHICGHRLFTEYELKKHMLKHSDARPFSCDFCGKLFKTKRHLTIHRRIHLNERRYQCKICDKAFVQSTSLKVHMKSRHGDV